MIKYLIVFLILGVSSSAFASGTFCSGFLVHYVDQRSDLGTPPPVGFKLGETQLTIDGQSAGKIEYFSQQPSVGSFEYEVELTNKVTLARHGHPTMGWEVFSANLFAQPKGNSKPIIDEVVCKTTWALVP